MPRLAQQQQDNTKRVLKLFDLTGRVALITGGAGLLGVQHAEAIAEVGGIVVLLDIDGKKAAARAKALSASFGVEALGVETDVTQTRAVEDALRTTLSAFGRVDILINNAAHNPTVGTGDSSGGSWTQLETLSLEVWERDIAVGLTGAFLCSQVIGGEMARRGKGVILSIASDLSVIAPDQRIYRSDTMSADEQPVKPVTYSVIKTGLVGLTRYLATYWAERNVRVNALSPGGVYDRQPSDFVARLTQLIPLRRMATLNEYQGAIVFLCSDASSYMTGQNVVIDGGRSVW